MKKFDLYTNDMRGNYCDDYTFNELVERYGDIPLPERLIPNIIQVEVTWNIGNGKMFIAVKTGKKVINYSLDNIHGSWVNLTRYR